MMKRLRDKSVMSEVIQMKINRDREMVEKIGQQISNDGLIGMKIIDYKIDYNLYLIQKIKWKNMMIK